MSSATCDASGKHVTRLAFFVLLTSYGSFAVRVKRSHTGGAKEPREACTHVTLQPPKSYRPGHLEFANADASAFIHIEDEGTIDWNIQDLSGLQVANRPSVHIDLVSVDCVLKGLCKDMVTVAIDHWRFQVRNLEGVTPFAVSLQFAADPAVAGCICYMDAMISGHTRSSLFVQTKSNVEVSKHEGFVTQGKDIALDPAFQGSSFTIAQAAQACLTTMVPGCKGFSINRVPPEDPATPLRIEEFHFKSSMDDLNITGDLLDLWTSYSVKRGPPPPYELQYAAKDGHHWYREWCVQKFNQTSQSPLQGKSWLFL